MIIFSLESNLADSAKKMLAYGGHHRIYWIEGVMGAGKTRLIKQLCHELGVIDRVSSPTFGIVHEYKTEQGLPVYHFDCYRIAAVQEAIDLDFESYFASGSYCFVEWGANIRSIFPESYLHVDMQIKDHHLRHLLCKRV